MRNLKGKYIKLRTDASKQSLLTRIAWLEDENGRLQKLNKRLRAAIRCQEVKPPNDVNDDLTTEFAVEIALMKKRERVIASAFLAVLESLPEGFYPTKDEKGTILFGRQLGTNSTHKVTIKPDDFIRKSHESMQYLLDERG